MSVKVVHNSNEGFFDLKGRVGAARRALQQVFNIPADATAFVGGVAVGEDQMLVDGDILEFVRQYGFKGLGGLLTPADLRGRWQINCDQYVELCNLGLPLIKFRDGDVRHPEAAVDEFFQRLLIGPHVACVPKGGAIEGESNPQRRSILDNNEADAIVKAHLKKRPNATIREISAATNISQGRIAKLDAWRRIMNERNATRPAPKRSERPLTPKMLTSIGTRNNPNAHRISDDEVFRMMIEAAEPDERAELHSRSPSERASLIEAARQHYADRLDADK